MHKASKKADLSTGEALAGTPSRTMKSTYTRPINTAHGHATLSQVRDVLHANDGVPANSVGELRQRPAVFRVWYVRVAAQHGRHSGELSPEVQTLVVDATCYCPRAHHYCQNYTTNSARPALPLRTARQSLRRQAAWRHQCIDGVCYGVLEID